MKHEIVHPLEFTLANNDTIIVDLSTVDAVSVFPRTPVKDSAANIHFGIKNSEGDAVPSIRVTGETVSSLLTDIKAWNSLHTNSQIIIIEQSVGPF